MIVGVIGSGSIGPDLAYGFMSSLANEPESKVYLVDIKQEALDAGMNRIRGYVQKGLDRGKLNPKIAKVVETSLIPTLNLKDLANCEYVLEAATENLSIKKEILKNIEAIVSKDCLIGFATSGLPRARIAKDAKHPQRMFVNHPFFPAWRALPIEVVPSEDEKLTAKMMDTLRKLGKVPIKTADAVCFAADDIFCNYCAEAARIFVEGVATPAQIDKIVNDAIGGGGPFNVMDLTQGNLLNVHCSQLMQDEHGGNKWFAPPEIFTKQANTPWHDRKKPGDPTHDKALAKKVIDRILAVIIGRTYYVADNKICEPTDLNWLTRMALGYRTGLLELAQEYGADQIHEICTNYAKNHPGYEVPKSIAEKKLLKFNRNVKVEHDKDIAVVTIFRPEVKNALNEQTMIELKNIFEQLGADNNVKGIVLTSFDGSIAGADIMELAALKTPKEAIEKCRRGQGVLDFIASTKKPVVAAIDGPVLGGGSELCMACHARVVGPNLMVGQPEVNLGIIPGYGGTQRLPRLIGLEKGIDLIRSGRPIGTKEACAWGWAHKEPAANFVAAAKDLIRQHIAGKVKIAPVNPEPMQVPEKLPYVDIGHRSLTIDEILVRVLRKGLSKPLAQGLAIEAEGFGDCERTLDLNIGMTNFIQNGPRVPAIFMNE